MKRDCYVYRAFDAEGRCLYVGRTNRVALRRREHEKHSQWYPLVTRTMLTGPLDAIAADCLERREITRGTSYTTRVQPSGIQFVSRKLGMAIRDEVSA